MMVTKWRAGGKQEDVGQRIQGTELNEEVQSSNAKHKDHK